jgi:hypothetical protein
MPSISQCFSSDGLRRSAFNATPFAKAPVEKGSKAVRSDGGYRKNRKDPNPMIGSPGIRLPYS